jgi:hypothetical protein
VGPRHVGRGKASSPLEPPPARRVGKAPTGKGTQAGIWSYGARDDWSSIDLVGYKVEATDGDIGKVDEKSKPGWWATSSWTQGRGSSARRSCFPQVCSTASMLPTERSTWTGPRTSSIGGRSCFHRLGGPRPSHSSWAWSRTRAPSAGLSPWGVSPAQIQHAHGARSRTVCRNVVQPTTSRVGSGSREGRRTNRMSDLTSASWVCGPRSSAAGPPEDGLSTRP